MDKIAERIFRYKRANFSKLSAYGFVEKDGALTRNFGIVGGQMRLKVVVDGDGKVFSAVTDLEMGENYSLFLVDDAVGGFVGEVRGEYERVLSEIAQNCFDKQVFKSDYANKVIAYIDGKYGDAPEYLWEKLPDCAAVRRADNRKWYAVIFNIKANKLGLTEDGDRDVIDLRAEPEVIDGLVDGKVYFRGYHMNKRNWITVCLDGNPAIEEIFSMIDTSYRLAKK